MINKLTIVTLIFIFSGCNYGNQYPQDLGDGYRFEYGVRGPFKWVVNSSNSIVVDEHVLEVAFDSEFIIAVQRPFSMVPECNPNSGYNYDHCKKAILKTSELKRYWIISKKEESFFVTEDKKFSNAYGPYNSDEYENMRKRLGVPSTLIFKDNL